MFSELGHNLKRLIPLFDTATYTTYQIIHMVRTSIFRGHYENT
jgi:hypothetical protein